MDKFKFRTKLGEDIFNTKYRDGEDDSWPMLAQRVVEDVCGTRWGKDAPLMSRGDQSQLVQYIKDMKFIPGGRYLRFAGRDASFFNNCYCLAAEEDTREEWAALMQRTMLALMTGGGVGIDYSKLRAAGRRLKRTGGVSSGPIPLMAAVNEVGRQVRQGGNRRSAMWAGLNWQHSDIEEFLKVKDWSDDIHTARLVNPEHPAPFDMTNISILWDTDFAEDYLKEGDLPDIWRESVQHMCKSGEPGHAYNFYEHETETLRNACTEFISDRDSDVCNLGSVNLSAVSSKEELADVVTLASKFLVCGTIRAELPYDKVKEVRSDYRKIGLGLMGLHEWLLQRGEAYEVTDELKEWLDVYKDQSEKSAKEHAERFFLNAPAAYRAIAPAGTIGLLAGTTTGIEPLYATAYKRHYFTDTGRSTQYVVDDTAKRIVNEYGIAPEDIDTALSLAKEPERRVRFQYEVQKYVDMGISSTINLPAWGTEYNNEDTADRLSETLAKYCLGLRGITVYPDGARTGQPMEEVSYKEAIEKEGLIIDGHEESCKGGVCGV